MSDTLPHDADAGAYARRDPRAGQGLAEHKVELTFYAGSAPDKCWRAAFTLGEIAEILRTDMAIDGDRLTAITLSEGSSFTGILALHRSGQFGFDGAVETLERRNVRGIIFALPDGGGWGALIPLSGPREMEVFEKFAARVNGLFAGRLDPEVFEPGHIIGIGNVRHLKAVGGELLDRNDFTYRTSIFRDGTTVAGRATVKEIKRLAGVEGPAAPAGALRTAVTDAIAAFEASGRMVDAALAYARHGFAIFPVTVDKIPVPARDKDANGKPIPGTGSFKKATTDPAQIRAWWQAGASYLIGLPMGAASGVCCIDVDTSEDHADGVAEWHKITAQQAPIVTREHRSATGGPHLLFDFARPIGCSSGNLPAGIDVKGEGSYIVVPPSRRKGRAYTVHQDVDPAPLPEWLHNLITAGRARHRDSGPFRDEAPVDAGELIDAIAWLSNVNVSWDDWKAMGLRIYAVLGSSGFGPFEQWSQKSSKYDPEKTCEAWEQIEASPPNRTGAGAIFKRALIQGWRPRLVECMPSYPAAGDDIEAARREIKARIDAFWARAEAYHARIAELTEQEGELRGQAEAELLSPWMKADAARKADLKREERERLEAAPPVEAVRIETGLGKTAQAIADVAAGGRSGLVYTVDRHLLGDKIEERLADVGVSAQVFRGRGADDPDHPGKQMCLEPARVALAMKFHADISSACCIQRRKGQVCPSFVGCPYQAQQEGAPQVWVTAHDMLFHTQKTFGKPKALIIDEAMWSKGIRGIEREENEIEWTVSLASLVTGANCLNKAGGRNVFRDLHRKALGEALARQADNGGVAREPLSRVLTTRQCSEAISCEWAAMPQVDMHPGMSRAQLAGLAGAKELIDAVQHARRVIRVWEEVRDLLRNEDIAVSGRLTLTQSNGQRIVEWRGVAKITKQFQVPTLLLDATLPEKPILQVYHPRVEVVADIRVALPPAVRVRQMLYAPTSSRKLNDVAHIDSVQRYILQRWFETGRGPSLVICQQKVEEALLQRDLPANITLAHYNNIAGLDDFKEVRLKILIGRTAPGPQAMEALAAALSGSVSTAPAAAPNVGGFTWYPRVARGIRLRDGRGIRTWGDRHDDPFVEAIRWLVHEGELMQAFGRARPVNRAAATPLDIDLLFDTCLPITVDEVVAWRSPSLLVVTATEGVMLTSPTDMVKLWPKLWPNRTAADRTLAAGVPDLPGFEQVAYQLKGPKMKQRIALFDHSIVSDPQQWLEERLGPLS